MPAGLAWDLFQLGVILVFFVIGVIPEVRLVIPENWVIITIAATLVTYIIDSDQRTRGLSIAQGVFTLIMLIDYLFKLTSHISDNLVVIILWIICAGIVIATNVIQMGKRNGG